MRMRRRPPLRLRYSTVCIDQRYHVHTREDLSMGYGRDNLRSIGFLHPCDTQSFHRQPKGFYQPYREVYALLDAIHFEVTR